MRPTAQNRSARDDQGLTLIELVVAMAIFALVSVMGLQSLTGSMRMRDRLMMLDADTTEVGMSLALLRNDLEGLVPMLFYPPGSAPRSAIDLDPGGNVLSLSLDGQPVMPGGSGQGTARVEWRVNTQDARLMRRAWPTLFPDTPQVVSPEVTVLKGVTGITLRSFWPQLGWRPGVTSNRPADPVDPGGDSDTALARVAESYSSSLPLAIEVVLETDGFGSIRLVETLQ